MGLGLPGRPMVYLFEGIIASTCSNVEAVKKWAKIKVLTIIDFTKTYHGPSKIHGLFKKSVQNMYNTYMFPGITIYGHSDHKTDITNGFPLKTAQNHI